MDECKSERQSQVTTEMNQLDKGLMIIEESVASLMSMCQVCHARSPVLMIR